MDLDATIRRLLLRYERQEIAEAVIRAAMPERPRIESTGRWLEVNVEIFLGREVVMSISETYHAWLTSRDEWANSQYQYPMPSYPFSETNYRQMTSDQRRNQRLARKKYRSDWDTLHRVLDERFPEPKHSFRCSSCGPGAEHIKWHFEPSTWMRGMHYYVCSDKCRDETDKVIRKRAVEMANVLSARKLLARARKRIA